MDIPNGNYIVVEGNIGAGKTSLSRMLAAELNGRLILEEFSDNPFLPLFYQNPERYAFPVELFFMTERHKQLQSLLIKGHLFQQYVVSDYTFSKTLLFAGQNLENEELRLFRKLFYTLNASFPKPNLLVYLHRSVNDLIENIHKRGRAYEKDISAEYLEKIQKAYFSFFEIAQSEMAILFMDLEGLDFVHNPCDYQLILKQLAQPYSKGIHQWSLQQSSAIKKTK